MRAPSPAFSLYPKDILSDEHCSAMTHEEFGAYVRLMMHAWLEGSVPADPVRLARILKVRHKTFGRIWPAIEPCFEARGERLIQLRLEQERVKQRERSAAQSAKGRKGGRPAKSTPGESRGLAAGKPEENLPSSSSFPSSSSSTDRWPGPRANPLVGDRRSALETELLKAVREIAEREGREPTEVMGELSAYQGRSVMNPASMSDDRLLQTLNAARKRSASNGDGEPTEAELKRYLEKAREECPDWSDADQRGLARETWEADRRREARRNAGIPL